MRCGFMRVDSPVTYKFRRHGWKSLANLFHDFFLNVKFTKSNEHITDTDLPTCNKKKGANSAEL